MELEPIANEATPPTMSKERSRGTSRKGTGEEGPMVDRYGFVVDVRRGMKLLRASGGAGKLKDDDLSTSTRDGEEGEGEVPQESMKLLFNQLTEMHNKTDATASLSWDSFIRRRQVTLSSSARRAVSKSKPAKGTLLGGELGAGDEGWSENLVGVAQMGLDGKKGDWLEFKGLVRKGITIAYRPKYVSPPPSAPTHTDAGSGPSYPAQMTSSSLDCTNRFSLSIWGRRTRARRRSTWTAIGRFPQTSFSRGTDRGSASYGTCSWHTPGAIPSSATARA